MALDVAGSNPVAHPNNAKAFGDVPEAFFLPGAFYGCGQRKSITIHLPEVDASGVTLAGEQLVSLLKTPGVLSDLRWVYAAGTIDNPLMRRCGEVGGSSTFSL